jgi:hypothetical protein
MLIARQRITKQPNMLTSKKTPNRMCRVTESVATVICDGISLDHLEDSLLLTVLCSPLASRGQQSLFDCPL